MLSYFIMHKKTVLLGLFTLTGSFLNGMEGSSENPQNQGAYVPQSNKQPVIAQIFPNSVVNQTIHTPKDQTLTHKYASKSWSENFSSIGIAVATQTTATVTTSLTIAAITKGYQLLFPSPEQSIAQITSKMSALNTLIKINENNPEVLERLLEEMSKLQNQCEHLLCKQAGISPTILSKKSDVTDKIVFPVKHSAPASQ